jgi:hypothetical protein
VLRTLQSLDVDHAHYRYYPNALEAVDIAEAPEDVRQWLKLAIEFDYTARLLIRFALRSAVGAMADDAAPWVELARAAGAEEGPEGLIVKLVFGDKQEPEEDPQVASLRDKLSRLESFTKLAEALAADIRTRLPPSAK